ncbi:unnamed protein product [Acanthoscelides obtectus]|uniref:Uncharacterized protein n=1 Tax=Acanthoscelides obtectus TaxID=200917 RepID=A0A9P0MIR3_ACAOB|nr:unnamed protein product [Acanthoscelides obtectus]CAK1670993.1 hypothetical protein AOBTE_LOCUS27962 [Acanthoscelides obtectus]
MNAVLFQTLMTSNNRAKMIEHLTVCPHEVLEAAGHFFLSHRRLELPREENLPPISVDELYGCGSNDFRGRPSPLKRDDVAPRLILDLDTQMDGVVMRLMNTIQRLVKQQGWTKKTKCKSAQALDDSFKLLNRLVCCNTRVPCSLQVFKIPKDLPRSYCYDGTARMKTIDLEESEDEQLEDGTRQRPHATGRTTSTDGSIQ